MKSHDADYEAMAALDAEYSPSRLAVLLVGLVVGMVMGAAVVYLGLNL